MKPDAPVIPLAPKRAAAELRARTDDQLMQLAAAGVLEAFNEIVRRHERPVRTFCARVLANPVQGDDVAQEVFLEIWRTCQRYRQQGRFRGFLFSAARNRCLNELRARPAVAELDERKLIAPGDLLAAVLAAEQRRQLDAVVAGLPPKLRDAIWLRYAAELEYGEIAEIVRRPEETVRSRVFHGLKRLRKLLEGPGHEGAETESETEG